jgi:hypothetical protein
MMVVAGAEGFWGRTNDVVGSAPLKVVFTDVIDGLSNSET